MWRPKDSIFIRITWYIQKVLWVSYIFVSRWKTRLVGYHPQVKRWYWPEWYDMVPRCPLVKSAASQLWWCRNFDSVGDIISGEPDRSFELLKVTYIVGCARHVRMVVCWDAGRLYEESKKMLVIGSVAVSQRTYSWNTVIVTCRRYSREVSRRYQGWLVVGLGPPSIII